MEFMGIPTKVSIHVVGSLKGTDGSCSKHAALSVKFSGGSIVTGGEQAEKLDTS